MTDGKAQRPEESAEAPLGRSEPIPTPEGQGGGERAREAAKLLVSVVEIYAEYTTVFHQDPSDKNRRKLEVAWQAYIDQAVVAGEQIARALLSSPRVEEWKLIETAPKQRVILLWARTDVDNWKMATGYWMPGYGDESGEWTWDGRRLKPYDVQPTHWQETPEPPALSLQVG